MCNMSVPMCPDTSVQSVRKCLDTSAPVLMCLTDSSVLVLECLWSEVSWIRSVPGSNCLYITYVQRIRGFTTMRYINLRFTYLLTVGLKFIVQ